MKSGFHQIHRRLAHILISRLKANWLLAIIETGEEKYRTVELIGNRIVTIYLLGKVFELLILAGLQRFERLMKDIRNELTLIYNTNKSHNCNICTVSVLARQVIKQ